MKLINPNLELEDAFYDFCKSFEADDATKIHGAGGMAQFEGFREGVACCHDQAQGKNLPEGWVPSNTWWLVDNDQVILGTVSFRHELNPFLEAEGGHVGYSIRPTERGKGYATRILARVIEIAAEMGVRRLCVVCEKSNRASERVIQKNGGVLDAELVSSITGNPIKRYWIDTASSQGATFSSPSPSSGLRPPSP